MAELKTRPTGASVKTFLDGIKDPEQRADCRKLAALMKRVTGSPPKMWGPGMIGFGSYHYKNDSGREGDWFLAGFAPRASNISVYVMSGFDGYEALLSRLGKHKTGKACLYVKRLADIDLKVLEQLTKRSVAHMKRSRKGP